MNTRLIIILTAIGLSIACDPDPEDPPTGDTGAETSGSSTVTSTNDGSDGESGSGSNSGSSTAGSAGTLPVGEECTADADCMTGVCWDFNDYDRLCNGTVCSFTCTTDQDCITGAMDAGSTQPNSAQCGQDGRCDLVGTGLGSFTCA